MGILPSGKEDREADNLLANPPLNRKRKEDDRLDLISTKSRSLKTPVNRKNLKNRMLHRHRHPQARNVGPNPKPLARVKMPFKSRPKWQDKSTRTVNLKNLMKIVPTAAIMPVMTITLPERNRRARRRQPAEVVEDGERPVARERWTAPIRKTLTRTGRRRRRGRGHPMPRKVRGHRNRAPTKPSNSVPNCLILLESTLCRVRKSSR